MASRGLVVIRLADMDGGETVSMHAHRLWHLPEAPGTVIAIGAWWFVKLEPHEGVGPGCWELLPARDEKTRQSMERAGVKAQCVYSDDWVLTEAEQQGGYLVVATAESTWYGPTMRNLLASDRKVRSESQRDTPTSQAPHPV